MDIGLHGICSHSRHSRVGGNPFLHCHSECSEESSHSKSLVGGSPTPNHFLLSVQKKVIKEKYTPCQDLRLPCATHQVGRLRNSPLQASQIKACSELKQSSPKTPALIVLLGMGAGDSYGTISIATAPYVHGIHPMLLKQMQQTGGHLNNNWTSISSIYQGNQIEFRHKYL